MAGLFSRLAARLLGPLKLLKQLGIYRVDGLSRHQASIGWMVHLGIRHLFTGPFTGPFTRPKTGPKISSIGYNSQS